MATKTITLRHKVSGVLTDVTSAMLSDPTEAYGVRRTDTLDVVVANDTPLVWQSTGVYQYTFTEPALGLSYQSYIEYVHAGTTHRIENLFVGSTVAVYAQQSDIEDLFGVTNVRVYSNLENDAAATDTNRVEKSLAWAEAYIHTRLGDSGMTIPLLNADGTTLSGDALIFVRDLAARLAGVWLYESRGLRDEVTDNKMVVHKEYVDAQLAMLAAGTLLFDVEYDAETSTGNAPIIVEIPSEPVLVWQ